MKYSNHTLISQQSRRFFDRKLNSLISFCIQGKRNKTAENMMFDVMMMMNRRITPVGPVVAMAYVHKVVSEENFVEVKIIGEAFDKKVEGRNSTHKSSTMDYQLFPADENVKQTELNGMSPSTKAGDSFKISSSVMFMACKDGSKSLSVSDSSIHNRKADCQSQTLPTISDKSGNVMLPSAPKTAINEDKKENSFPLPLAQSSDNEKKVNVPLQEPLPQIKPSTKSWVKLFTPESKEHRNVSKVESKPEIKKPPKEIKPPEPSQNQTNSDGWSEVKKKKKKCH